MKLFSEFSTLMEDLKQPWYVAVRPDLRIRDEIFKIATEAGVPKLHQKDKYHSTLIYSRQPCKQPSPKPKMTFAATADKWEIFHTRSGENCLVLKLDSPALQQRHKRLMTELEATYDFPSYLPHITVSYDVGDFDISKLAVPSSTFAMTGEYDELLDDLE